MYIFNDCRGEGVGYARGPSAIQGTRRAPITSPNPVRRPIRPHLVRPRPISGILRWGILGATRGGSELGGGDEIRVSGGFSVQFGAGTGGGL